MAYQQRVTLTPEALLVYQLKLCRNIALSHTGRVISERVEPPCDIVTKRTQPLSFRPFMRHKQDQISSREQIYQCNP